MKRLDARFERLDDIERKLGQHPAGLSIPSLVRIYGVNRSTIYRDLRDLEKRGMGLIQEGHRWKLDHRRVLYATHFTPYELVSLYLAARLLARYSDEQNPHVSRALEKLADALQRHSPLVMRHIAQSAGAVAERPARPEYVRAFETLTQAWLFARKARITYQGFNDEQAIERRFSPYIIEPTGLGYSTYVIGYDDLRGAVRTLKLDRIRSAQLTDESFTRALTTSTPSGCSPPPGESSGARTVRKRCACASAHASPVASRKASGIHPSVSRICLTAPASSRSTSAASPRSSPGFVNGARTSRRLPLRSCVTTSPTRPARSLLSTTHRSCAVPSAIMHIICVSKPAGEAMEGSALPAKAATRKHWKAKARESSMTLKRMVTMDMTPPPDPSIDNTADPLSGLTPWTLWAKWSRPTQQPNSYHPLLCHLIDVAQCAEAMWRRVLPDAWKWRLADELGL